jgi:hypothetical protein
VLEDSSVSLNGDGGWSVGNGVLQGLDLLWLNLVDVLNLDVTSWVLAGSVGSSVSILRL